MGSFPSLSHQKISAKVKIGVIQLGIILLFILFVGSISYNKYNQTLQDTTKSLNEKIISYHFETFEKLSNIFLTESNHNFIFSVEHDPHLVKHFESMMDLIRISTIQNLFVVAKNRTKEYYFLLDSEMDPKKRASMYEPFDPLGDVWDRCYKSQKSQIYYHNNNKKLWITIVYPIVQNNKTVALIGADISHQLDINMKQKLQDFTHFFFWLIFLSIVLFTFLYIFTLYFRTKYYDAYIDPLTEIYNRKYFYDIVLKKLSRSYQLFMIDIDFFKKVNDDHGHDVGDFVLKEVARRIESLIRDEDSLIRFGGEEFLIYTTILDPQKCKEFAERIREKVKKDPIVYKGIVCNITISIGVNPYAKKEYPFDEMLIVADDALYEAKHAGRDCVKMAQNEISTEASI